MDTSKKQFKIRLGLFVAGGLALFIVAIFIIGKQKNLFDPVFELNTTFNNVSGLEVGNNVRFAGINVGVVDNIGMLNDSTVKVKMLIQKDVKQFIKTDCEVVIGSAGIIGDRILTITQGSLNAPLVKDGANLQSAEPVEMSAIMESLLVTADNAAIVSDQLLEVIVKLNSGQGIIGRLISDSLIGEDFSQTMENIKKSSQGLNENMNAAKENFLLKGYFRRKAQAEEDKKKEEEKAKKAAERDNK